MKTYLTENTLEFYLSLIYPNHKFIRNKIVPNSNIQNRPDYRNDKLMLIVEFDGYGHYIRPDIIMTDYHKDNIYQDMGYTVVRIPYFIQISESIIKLLFNKNLKIEQEYPHGFIDYKATLPAYFCELGIQRFIEDLEKFSIVRNEIIKSLKDMYDKYNNINYVLPPSLKNLLIEDGKIY